MYFPFIWQRPMKGKRIGLLFLLMFRFMVIKVIRYLIIISINNSRTDVGDVSYPFCVRSLSRKVSFQVEYKELVV